MVSDAEAALAALHQAASLPDHQVFARTEELQLIISRTKCLRSIQVVIGPTNAGKTAILNKFISLWKSNEYLQTHRPIFHLDMKSIELRTVEGAARALQVYLKDWIRKLKKIAAAILRIRIQVLGTTVDLSSLGDFINKKPEAFSLEILISCINKLGKNVKPVWVIDEFQRLKHWGEKDNMDFLTHLVRITKQEGQASVFLSTSDDQFQVVFQNLTSRGISTTHFWDTIGVGFFRQEDAKAFIANRLRGYELAGKDWNMIYEVCGGCPKLLVEVADTVLDRQDVLRVLNRFASDGMLLVQQGFCDSWDSERYTEIMKLIVAADDGSVPVGTIRKKVYGGDLVLCKSELRALVAANVFQYRYSPKDVWYSDLVPSSAKSDGRLMARSPPHRHAMKLFLQDPDEYF